jgi:hypothetical protein
MLVAGKTLWRVYALAEGAHGMSTMTDGHCRSLTFGKSKPKYA